MFDLLEENHVAPQREHADGYKGPYKVSLRVEEGRLAIGIARENGQFPESVMLGLGRFRRPIRDYFAICDSYYQAIRQATPQQIESVAMARRGIHNEGDRKSVVSGKSVSVRVDLVGRRLIKKKQ